MKQTQAKLNPNRNKRVGSRNRIWNCVCYATYSSLRINYAQFCMMLILFTICIRLRQKEFAFKMKTKLISEFVNFCVPEWPIHN